MRMPTVELSAEAFDKCFPHCPPNHKSTRRVHLNDALKRIDATTVDRAACFIGQVGHESGDLRFMREIWKPTKLPIQSTYERNFDAPWPPSSTDRRNRKAHLLGNSERGDGRRFRGVGPLQVTGRGHVTACSLWAYGDRRLAEPGADLDSPDVGFTAASWFWLIGVSERLSKRASRYLSRAGYDVAAYTCNQAADKGDLEGLTLSINGGLRGQAGRLIDIRRAREALERHTSGEGMPQV